MHQFKVGDRARYGDHRVEILALRPVAGGVAADVRRHATETAWPWTVERFTTAAANLTAEAAEPCACMLCDDLGRLADGSPCTTGAGQRL